MRLFGLKNCDACRRTMKSVPGIQLVDVREQRVPEAILLQAFEEFGAALLNTRSTTWRGLNESERSRPAMDLLKDYPTLMKRPLIEKDGRLFLGWTAETRTGLGVE